METENKQISPNLLQNHYLEKDNFVSDINLKEYLYVLYKRKITVLICLSLSIIAVIIFNMVATKIYEASVLIMITPSKIPSVLMPTNISLDVEKKSTGEYISQSQRSTISLPTHQMLLKSNIVLENIINELQLTNETGLLLDPLDLYSKLKVEIARSQEEEIETKGEVETSILTLETRHSDSQKAQAIANTWAKEYIKYSQELIGGEIKGTGDFINEQFAIAKQNLIESEKAIKNYNLEKNPTLLSIELGKKNTELQTNYQQIQDLNFELIKKNNNLQKINQDLAVLTKNNEWLGFFDLINYTLEEFQDTSLSPENQTWRLKILEWIKTLQTAKEKRDEFINETKIKLLRIEEENLRNSLTADKNSLAELNRLSQSIESTLETGTQLNIFSEMEGTTFQNLPESTVWEILSLEEKYNFFKSQETSLAAKVAQEEEQLQKLEKDLSNYEKELTQIENTLNQAQANYNFYYDRFNSFYNAKRSLEIEIENLKYQLAYAEEMIKKLDAEVKNLQNESNNKEFELTELNRQLDIYKNTYINLASKIEEARIIKAAQLGEVRIVSPALESKTPIKPEKKKNIVIAVFLGLVAGISMAFLEEYWRKIKKEKTSLQASPSNSKLNNNLKVSLITSEYD